MWFQYQNQTQDFRKCEILGDLKTTNINSTNFKVLILFFKKTTRICSRVVWNWFFKSEPVQQEPIYLIGDLWYHKLSILTHPQEPVKRPHDLCKEPWHSPSCRAISLALLSPAFPLSPLIPIGGGGWSEFPVLDFWSVDHAAKPFPFAKVSCHSFGFCFSFPSHCCTKIFWQENGGILVHSSKHSPFCWEIKSTWTWSRVTSHSQSGIESNKWHAWQAQFAVPCIIQGFILGNYWPTVRIGFPTSNNIIKTIPLQAYPQVHPRWF